MNNIKLTSISFFCPAYNDEANLPDLIPSVVKFLNKHAHIYEVVIIDDGAKDKTGDVADMLASKFEHVRVIHHEENKGYTATLKEGFETGCYEYIMYTDGDNQYNIFDFEPYLDKLQKYDVLSGYATKKAVSLFRRFQSYVHNILIALLFFKYYKDINCSMKIFKKKVIDSIDIESSPQGAFIDAELILKSSKKGFKIYQFPVIHYERKNGIALGSKPKLIFITILDMLKFRLNI